jgi:hypothetical protein
MKNQDWMNIWILITTFALNHINHINHILQLFIYNKKNLTTLAIIIGALIQFKNIYVS